MSHDLATIGAKLDAGEHLTEDERAFLKAAAIEAARQWFVEDPEGFRLLLGAMRDKLP